MSRHLNAYLTQREYWMSKSGEFPIRDMDMRYRGRAIHWLTRNSADIFRLWTLEAFIEGEEAPGLETLIQWIDARPQNWVKALPLYAALVEGLPAELV
jgi:hypothetical protein